MDLNKIKEQLSEVLIAKASPYIKDAKNYWLRLSQREQIIVKLGTFALIIMFLFVFVSPFLQLENNLIQNIQKNSVDLANAKILKLKMQDLSSITANEFVAVSAQKVKGDIKELFNINNPNVALNDDTLIITINDAKFDLIMLFLDQLRKSYGIFPEKLKIYRSSQSGLVNFYATFHVER